jgi:hypothetical protein
MSLGAASLLSCDSKKSVMLKGVRRFWRRGMNADCLIAQIQRFAAEGH